MCIVFFSVAKDTLNGFKGYRYRLPTMASLSNLKYLTECPVCLESDTVPKRLSCEHPLCVKCVESIIKSNPGCRTHGEDVYIPCPTCNLFSNVPNGKAERLPTHLLMIQLREELLANKTERCQLCQKISNKKISKYCQECKMYLCVSCVTQHRENDMLKTHKLIDPMAMLVCCKHGHKLTYFCPKCNISLCIGCINEEQCKDHVSAIKSLDDAGEDPQAAINDIIATLTDCIENTNPGVLAEKIQAAERTKDQIEEHAQRLIINITDTTVQLLDVVREEEKTLKKLQGRVDILTSLLQLALESKDQGREQMFVTANAIKGNMQTFLASHDNLVMGTLQFEPENTVLVGTINMNNNNLDGNVAQRLVENEGILLEGVEENNAEVGQREQENNEIRVRRQMENYYEHRPQNNAHRPQENYEHRAGQNNVNGAQQNNGNGAEENNVHGAGQNNVHGTGLNNVHGAQQNNGHGAEQNNAHGAQQNNGHGAEQNNGDALHRNQHYFFLLTLIWGLITASCSGSAMLFVIMLSFIFMLIVTVLKFVRKVLVLVTNMIVTLGIVTGVISFVLSRVPLCIHVYPYYSRLVTYLDHWRRY